MRTIISYEPLWKTLQEKGISQYYLLQNGLDNKTLDSLKKGKNITLLTLEKLSQCLRVGVGEMLAESSGRPDDQAPSSARGAQGWARRTGSS